MEHQHFADEKLDRFGARSFRVGNLHVGVLQVAALVLESHAFGLMDNRSV